jgi:hypothetical protein
MTTKNRRFLARGSGLTGNVLALLGHLAGVAIVSILVTTVFFSPDFAFAILGRAMGDADLREMSVPLLALHVGLSACIWAFGFIVFLWGRERARETRDATRRTVKLARGSVMTETLVVLPVFFVLVFGMSQMVINNMTGILANVAVSEGARSAWVWQPEIGAGRGNVTAANALDRSRLAVAMVMTAVAPGDAGADSPILATTNAGLMRDALVASHAGILASAAPAGTGLAAWTLGTGLTMDPLVYTRGQQTVWRALDGGPFVTRTAKKFTHAYHSTNVTLNTANGRTGITMRYRHHIAMPLMGPMFGTFRAFPGGGSLRPGYYGDFNRTYGFRTQINTPNAQTPFNPFGTPSSGGGGFFGAIKDELGW